MKKHICKFLNIETHFYFDATFNELPKLLNKENVVLITDENVIKYHQKKISGWPTIVLKPGEKYKNQQTVNYVIQQLIKLKADRTTTLVGVGGGVVTDITGYVASIYMRGVSFGFIPTTVLAMVDAAIGGKNGIDIGIYKNLLGTINQPQFLLYDISFLNSLPKNEWENGFAEIIKHACIKDEKAFKILNNKSISFYKKNKSELNNLIQKNALCKATIVQSDELEKGDRKLLNFGHTLGHAIEKTYQLSHGQAISIGMVAASRISEQLTGFRYTQKIVDIFKKYNLPTYIQIDKRKIFKALEMDKKKEQSDINYILLEKIGKGVIKKISLDELKLLLNN